MIGIVMLVYFIIRGIFMLIVFAFAPGVTEFLGIINVIFNIMLLAAAIISCIYLLKARKWALITIIVILIINIISTIGWALYMGRFKLPIAPIFFLMFSIGAFRHLKKIKTFKP
jgi:hypothetical protein